MKILFQNSVTFQNLCWITGVVFLFEITLVLHDLNVSNCILEELKRSLFVQHTIS